MAERVVPLEPPHIRCRTSLRPGSARCTRGIASATVRRRCRRILQSPDCRRRIWNNAYSPNERLVAQLIEQRLGLFKVGGVEAFSEPTVNLREHRTRFVAAALVRKQLYKTHGRAQFVRFRALLARNLNSPLKAALSFGGVGIALPEQ